MHSTFTWFLNPSLSLSNILYDLFQDRIDVQDNIHELWSLFNFLLSEMISSGETIDERFQIWGENSRKQSWFDFYLRAIYMQYEQPTIALFSLFSSMSIIKNLIPKSSNRSKLYRSTLATTTQRQDLGVLLWVVWEILLFRKSVCLRIYFYFA